MGINDLPTIETYDDSRNSKNVDVVNFIYIICSKHDVVKDKNFTKVFDTKMFEIYKSKIFQ